MFTDQTQKEHFKQFKWLLYWNWIKWKSKLLTRCFTANEGRKKLVMYLFLGKYLRNSMSYKHFSLSMVLSKPLEELCKVKSKESEKFMQLVFQHSRWEETRILVIHVQKIKD